jgi:homoserine kinase
MRVVATAPASMGNVGVGFDILGAALRAEAGEYLGDRVTVEDAPEDRWVAEGPFAHQLPPDPRENLVERARRAVAARPGARVRPARTTLHKGLPIGSGLGSSASSIVAAVVAFDAFYETLMGVAESLRLMGELEGSVSGSVHYDNVGPAFLGGIQLLLHDGAAQRVPVFSHWRWVLLHPGTSLPTAEARAVMPKTYPTATVVDYGCRVAGFVHACHTGDSRLAAGLMVDPLAEPHRASLLPHLGPARDLATSEGALAAGISGSGPTVFAVAPDDRIARRIRDRFEELVSDPAGFVRICRIPEEGVRLEVT